MDWDLDVVGVYALGHYSPEQFFSAIRQQEPYACLQPHRFRHSWMKFHENGFEEFSAFQEGTEAVTILDDLQV